MIEKIKSKRLNYIFNCDLVNKYLCKNVFEIPRISNVVIQLDLQELSKLNESLTIPLREKEYKIKAFLLLFFYFLNIPYYKIKNIVEYQKRIKIKRYNKNFLQLCCSNKTFFTHFLFNLFIENQVLVNNQNKNSFNKVLITPSTDDQHKMFHLFVIAKSFENFEKMCFLMFNDSNIKNLNFKLMFKMYLPKISFNVKVLMQNIPFFWING